MTNMKFKAKIGINVGVVEQDLGGAWKYTRVKSRSC